ncbi:hypothetical protein [Thioalkalivibrio sp. HK1]|uniref:hypothetical protein n=1 Tax=Thioalkalivibrio sp. HK1 TaxID=1469245 RepID=UPI0012DBCF63|nr:hypothetical protein [Thioalkalivibrio sp. HK1]
MNEDRHLPYKQRYCLEDLPQAMRVGELSADLRREIWNSILQFIESYTDRFDSRWLIFYRRTIGEYTKSPIDDIGMEENYALGVVKNIIINDPAENTLQFIEILLNDELISGPFTQNSMVLQSSVSGIPETLLDLFEKHTAPYRIDLSTRPFRIFQHTSKEEAEATARSLQTIKDIGGFDGALTHLRNAAEFINGRKFKDSIRHSITAVESVARMIEPDAKTLGDALLKLEKSGIIKHQAFKIAFEKLYGYTNTEGIRHALLDQTKANVGLPEALFFYNACAAFVGYLATVGNIR